MPIKSKGFRIDKHGRLQLDKRCKEHFYEDKPNAETLKAMQDAREGKTHKAKDGKEMIQRHVTPENDIMYFVNPCPLCNKYIHIDDDLHRFKCSKKAKDAEEMIRDALGTED